MQWEVVCRVTYFTLPLKEWGFVQCTTSDEETDGRTLWDPCQKRSSSGCGKTYSRSVSNTDRQVHALEESAPCVCILDDPDER